MIRKKCILFGFLKTLILDHNCAVQIEPQFVNALQTLWYQSIQGMRLAQKKICSLLPFPLASSRIEHSLNKQGAVNSVATYRQEAAYGILKVAREPQRFIWDRAHGRSHAPRSPQTLPSPRPITNSRSALGASPYTRRQGSYRRLRNTAKVSRQAATRFLAKMRESALKPRTRSS